jgi:hypothetical protein
MKCECDTLQWDKGSSATDKPNRAGLKPVEGFPSPNMFFPLLVLNRLLVNLIFFKKCKMHFAKSKR